MLPNPCPWTAAAIACEVHTGRAWGDVHDTRSLAITVDPAFPTVRKGAQQLADSEAVMAEALAWARDFFIFASQHPEEFERFRRRLELRDRLAARTPVAKGATTAPAGGTVISILDRLGPR